MNIKGYIEGVFWQKEKLLQNSYPKEKKQSLLYSFHGSYSSSYNSEKDEIIAKLIINENLGNVILYETSRQIYTFESSLPFEEYKNVFGPKTFQQELQDVKTLFQFFRKTFIKGNNLIFVGFSLGGTLSSYFYQPMENILKVFLFNSGITTKIKGSTYSHYPNKEEILENFASYSGEIVLVQGREIVLSHKTKQLKFLT